MRKRFANYILVSLYLKYLNYHIRTNKINFKIINIYGRILYVSSNIMLRI